MDRRRLLLVAAATVAALGTLLVFLYVRGADARAAQRFDNVEVLRAVTQIDPGETIEAAAGSGKLQLQPVPRSQLLPDFQTTIDALKGLVATTTIYPGEQIISDKFGGVATARSALTIPVGQMAISVNLTDPARVAGFVNPGSQVAIFLNGTDPQNSQPFTRLLLQRVTVLGVGSSTPVSTTTTATDGQQTTEQLPRTLLTLAVDQVDAQRVLYAAGNGELALGLLTDNSRVRPSRGVSAPDLFK